MSELLRKIRQYIVQNNISSWLVLVVLVYIIMVIKVVAIKQLDNSFIFGLYGIAVSFYILSRFVLSYLYVPESGNVDQSYEPTISFAVPAKNEGENIRETILRIAAVDYPKNKFDIIAINDGSTDNTLAEMREAAKIAKTRGVNVRVTDWKINRGKRDGMAECTRQSKAEIIVFIDSDSFVDRDIARAFVKYFVDARVGAVAGHAYVANAEKNMLTKMQAVRYYIAFKAYKAAEALFGNVTCCSGCCSAYRRSYILPVMNTWLNQYFLGVRCTYGDDRSLTNLLLKKGYKTLFAPEAIAHTFVPETLRQFTKQQLRWKKSWIRENLIAMTFMWRRNIIMSISFYLGVILPLVSPIIVFRAFVVIPYMTGNMPIPYITGIVLMAFLYGFYYQIYTRDRKWIYGVMFASASTLMLIWQLPYAILNLRDTRWGTR